MPVSKDLQTIVSRIGISIAKGESYGNKIELPRLVQELRGIVEDAQREEARSIVDRRAMHDLVDSMETGVRDLSAVVGRVKSRLPELDTELRAVG